jgi:hypothetical protein
VIVTFEQAERSVVSSNPHRIDRLGTIDALEV